MILGVVTDKVLHKTRVTCYAGYVGGNASFQDVVNTATTELYCASTPNPDASQVVNTYHFTWHPVTWPGLASQVAIHLSHLSMGSKIMVASDFRLEVEIRPFRACAMHPVIIEGTIQSLWTWLWGRKLVNIQSLKAHTTSIHVPQNVFVVSQ